MAEYIERENAYKLISEQKEKETGMYSKGRNMGLKVAKSIIHNKEQCPAADVVEVVRCKECKYWGGVIFGYVCRRFSGTHIRNETRENDFCSCAKLKEREG